MNLTKPLIPVLFAAFALSGCGCNDKKPTNQDDPDALNNLGDADVVKVGNRLFSIPSPVQTSILVKESGAEYDKKLLNDVKSVARYNSNIQKSLNLGIYGADLGYVNLYGQTQDAVNYLNAAKKLADDLGVTGAFSEDFIHRFQENLGNTDSLLVLVSDAYQIIDEYLQNNENNDIGGLVLTGGWIEALYFTTQVNKLNPTKDLKQRIGEQKFSIDNLIKMLTSYSNSNVEEYKTLIDGLVDLKSVYDKVEVSYEYAKPVVDEKKKLTIIKNKTEVLLDDVLVSQITEKISIIRANVIK